MCHSFRYKFSIYKNILPIFLCVLFFEVKLFSTVEDVLQLPEDNICAKFSLQFLEEFSRQNSSAPLFGWITAKGNVMVGQNNGTHFGIQCLALALSDWDFLVDRTCLMSLALQNVQQQHFVASPWHNQSDQWEEDNGKSQTDQNDVSYIGPLRNDDALHSAQLISFDQKRRSYKRPTKARPCIFPIDHQLETKLNWSGTICGLKKTVHQNIENGTYNANDSRQSQKVREIVCHPLKLELENGQMNDHSGEPFRLLHTQFREKSPLFLFDENAPNNTYLRAVGTLNESIQFFDKNDCERLSMHSDERIQCAAADNYTNYYAAAHNYTNSNAPRPFTQADANAAFILVPLVILSLLITTGMLITVIAFIVQQKRQMAYSTIN